MVKSAARSRLIGAVLLVVYLAFAAVVVLWPQRVDGNSLGVFRVLYGLYGVGMPRWITYNLVQFAANIALAAPIGFFVAMMLPRGLWWIAALACVVLFAMAEAVQFLLPARVPSLLDWMANSVGGLLGALCWRLVGRRERAQPMYR